MGIKSLICTLAFLHSGNINFVCILKVQIKDLTPYFFHWYQTIALPHLLTKELM